MAFTQTLQDTLEAMDKISSIKECSIFAEKTLPAILEKLQKDENVTKAHRTAMGKALQKLRVRIHPARKCPQVIALLRAHKGKGEKLTDPDLAASYVKRCQQLKETEEGKRYDALVALIDRLWAPVARLDHGSGRSNRARRAKKAQDVFSKHAGLSKIKGAKVDRHGNAVGLEYDLGMEGAFDGLRVVILQQDEEGGFTCDRPIRALKSKGFEVDLYKVVTPTAGELDEKLENASQVWLCSSKKPILSDECLEVIVQHWQRGLGLYIFGDNEPWYEDANRLLEAMGLGFKMKGYYAGKQMVGFKTYGRAGGFRKHLLTTGLVQLYEGYTVAEIDPKKAALQGFDEILREHSGPLVVVARPAQEGCGPVIVDCALTKLYCEWNMGGSARFVRNCACWLSSCLQEEEEDQKDEGKKEKPVELCLDGCLKGECSITMEEDVPLALLATSMPDPEANTTDFALDNNLAVGRRNLVLCGQHMALNTAKVFLEQGEDPFSRRKVCCVIPLVDLSNKDNMTIVTELACSLFMGGRRMSRHALNILLSVCEEMLYRDNESPAFKFMIRQLLMNAVSTPDMLKAAPGGVTVPLVQGLAANITLTGELVPLRKSFAHVGRIVRLLKLHPDLGKVDDATLRRVARRSMIKVLVGAAIRAAKTNKEQKYGKQLMRILNSKLFAKVVHGIPITGTAKPVNQEDFREIVELGIKHCTPLELEEDLKRVAKTLGIDVVLNQSDVTEVALALWRRGRGGVREWQVLVEPLLKTFLEIPTFRMAWDTTKTQEVSTMTTRLEKELTGSFAVEPTYHAAYPWPGFVSPLGPSVFRCKCGMVFGDPTNQNLNFDELRERRNAHFRKVFNANKNGYPSETSVHFPLHRAVQRVVTRNKYTKEMTRTEDMEKSVAKYLVKKCKGNIHTATLLSDIRFALDTYLDCRRKGMTEPGKEASISFCEKAKVEQELILESRRLGKGDWVDPQRPREQLIPA